MYKISIRDSVNHELWYEWQGTFNLERRINDLMKRCVIGNGYDIIVTFDGNAKEGHEIGSLDRFPYRNMEE
jgi:hypothetical protein